MFAIHVLHQTITYQYVKLLTYTQRECEGGQGAILNICFSSARFRSILKSYQVFVAEHSVFVTYFQDLLFEHVVLQSEGRETTWQET